MNVLMMGLVRPSRANLATRMAEKAEAGIPNALSNICTVKGATLVPAAVEVERKALMEWSLFGRSGLFRKSKSADLIQLAERSEEEVRPQQPEIPALQRAHLPSEEVAEQITNPIKSEEGAPVSIAT